MGKAKAQLGEWIIAFFFVVVIYMLVRPGSPAADLVEALSKALTALVKLATAG